MNILINAANLHVGGGVQVASSFIYELSILLEKNYKSDNISVYCSDNVINNLPIDMDKNVFDTLALINLYGFKRPEKQVREKFDNFDVCFTVFGPIYFKPKVKFHIYGFAQAWIAYPHNLALPSLSFLEKIKSYIKFELQWLFFKKADKLIVEQKHVKDALISSRNYPAKKIEIVENCVSSVFLSDNNSLASIKHSLPDETDTITIGFLGRSYAHKNLSILPIVNKLIISKYKLKIRFLFTLSKYEMKALKFDSIPNFHSVGSLKVTQCPAFYTMIDGLVFPSLLECFSATPIEAMSMKVAVFASDLPFVKGICQDTAFYFDPLKPESIANSIFHGFNNKKLMGQKIEAAYLQSLAMPSASDRARKYLKILIDQH